MACNSDDRAWTVRDSSELWRPKPAAACTAFSPRSSCEDVPDTGKKLAAARKQQRLPPRSPRTFAASNVEAPKLELKIQCLSPRPPLAPKPTSARSSDSQKCLDFKVFVDRSSDFTCISASSDDQGNSEDTAKADDTRLFPGLDLEIQRDIFMDDSETDFWDCKLDEEDVTGFHSLSKSISNNLPARLGLNDSTTICTLNGERVVMQTNFAFQHTEEDAAGYARASREYLESQQNIRNYLDTARDEIEVPVEAPGSLTDETGSDTQTGPVKRRWPRISKHASGCEKPASSCETRTTGKKSKHSKTGKKSTSKPGTKIEGWPKLKAAKEEAVRAQVEGSPSQEPEADQAEETKPGGTEEDGKAEMGAEPNAEVPDSAKPLHEDKPEERNSLSKEKFCSILSFLKQVEDNNLGSERLLAKPAAVVEDHSPRTVLEPEDAASVSDSAGSNAVPDEPPKTPSSSAFNGIRKRIQDLKEKIVKQSERISELEAENESVKLEKAKAISAERERYSNELQDQAADYKAGIKKHMSISEKLMKDKEALSERCSDLTNSLNIAESKFEERLRVAKDQWNTELKRQKEAWSAGEKARREAWTEKKTKEIKEMTIVGLEPHIESIHECHRKELQCLEERHGIDLAKHLQKQSNQHRQEMAEMRDQLLKERDDLLDKERLAAHARMNEMAEKYEQQALQQRMRIANDLAQQLERSEASRRDDKQYTQELLARLHKETAEREEALRKQHEKALEEVQVRFQAETSTLMTRMDNERREWHQSLNDRVHRELIKKEEAVKARCIKERNKEIEMILDRMESEKLEAIAQNKREVMVKVEEMQEEKKSLLKKLRDNEARFMDLCKEVMEAKSAGEAERSELVARIDQLNGEARNQAALVLRLQEQLGFEKNDGKKEREKVESCLVKQEQVLESTRAELARSRKELEQLRARKAEQLEEVENRVKVAIEKKDEIIWGLRNQLETAHHQIRHTEELLQHEHSILFA